MIKMGLIDLHTHSLCSDGAQPPADVVRTAKAAGLSAIALSDHDCVDGVPEAMEEGKKLGIEVVPAVELSAQSDTELHILGYFIDIHNKKLKDAMEYALQVRVERQFESCRKLQEQGFDITIDEVKAEAHGNPVICRAHIAQIMVRKGYAQSVKDAFSKYLSVGCYAYSNREALTGPEAVSLIREAGGIAVAAHLHLIKLPDEQLREYLKTLIPYGLNGVEGYYTDYTPDMEVRYRSMAKELGLVISGGTDYHGANKPHIAIGKGRGELEIPYSVLEGIKENLI
ncbi:MAG: PHP domain-containing protein [Clostridia bacterium]|nr:PHP domain-containing protein [Clostridia bacterium]MBQ9997608.1 PHP domain-containing protein [Clostridia bacterium]